MESAYTTTRPTKDGWYDVIFEPGDEMFGIFLSINSDGSIVWGYDPDDDPELLEQDVPDEYRNQIQFRPSHPLSTT